MVGIFHPIIEAIVITVGIHGVGFPGILLAVLVGVFHTIGNVVIVGIGIEGVGINTGVVRAIATGFYYIGNAIFIGIAVGVEVVRVKIIGHSIAIVVGVGTIGDSIAVEVTGVAGMIGHTGIVIIGVV